MIRVTDHDGETLEFEDIAEAAEAYEDEWSFESAIKIEASGATRDVTAALIAEMREIEQATWLEREHIRAESAASNFI